MKRLIILICVFFTVMSVHARAILEDYAAADEKAKVSYAFGMAIGTNFNLSSMGIDFDYTALTEGIRAIVEGNATQFTEQEAMEIIEVALQNVMEERSSQNKEIEDEYLAVNSKRAGVQITPSGLQYEILKKTEGEKPKEDSVVRVKYTGTFIDGKLFDSSTDEEGSFIPLEMVINGWTEGLMLMSVGSSYRLHIPSDLAYGSEGVQGIIPPYSTLIFTVELLEIMEGEPGL